MSKILVLKPKAPEVQAFVYENETDLENLTRFVGKNPVIDFLSGTKTVRFRKQEVKDGSIVFRNEFGDVVKVMTVEEAENIYDIEGEYDFTIKSHANVVKVKELKSKKE